MSISSSSAVYTAPTGSSYTVIQGGTVTGAITGNPGSQYATPGLQTISSGIALSGSTITGTSLDAIPNSTYMVIPLEIDATQNVLSGGAALNTILSGTGNPATTPQDSAFQTVQSGGYASGTTIGTNGQSTIFNGGLASAVTLVGGKQIVSSGGTANGIIVSSGLLDLESGTATAVTLVSGSNAAILDNGGTLTSAIINSGTTLTLGSNTTAHNVTVSSGGTIILGSGANLIDTPFLDPNAVISLAGATNANVLSGKIISSGGTITTPQGQISGQNTPLLEILSNGSVLNVIAVPYTTTPYQFLTTSNGQIDLVTNFSQSTAPTFTNPETGATYTLTSGGVVTGSVTTPMVSGYWSTPVVTPGNQIISSGSAVSGSIVSGGYGYYNTDAIGIPTIATPSTQTVLSGGAALNTVVSGSVFQTAFGAMISMQYYANSTATQILQSGAYASNTTLNIFASSVIQSGAVSDNVTMTGAYLPYGNPAYSTNAVFGATQIVSSGGTLNSATMTSGSTLIINGGTVNNITTISGFFVSQANNYYPQAATALATIVDNGGTLTNVTLVPGTRLLVGSNTTVTNLTATSGATITLTKNANLLGDIQVDPHTTILLQGAGSTLSGIYGNIVSSSASPLYTTLATNEATTREAQTNPSILNVMSSGTIINQIALPSTTTPFSFVNAPSGNGIDLVIGTPCYCPGTLIMTPDGERLVEDLAIGDLVLTAQGEARPIHWIGRRAYDPLFAFGNRDILPVRFKAGSLGNNLPRRDLTVSPLHAMFLDGYLIPALHLVNNRSIYQITKPDSIISYIHIELESHDVLLAEGAPSESFLDDGSRGMFHNAHHYAEQYPNAPKKPALYYAPRLEGGAELARIQQKLLDLASPLTHKTA